MKKIRITPAWYVIIPSFILVTFFLFTPGRIMAAYFFKPYITAAEGYDSNVFLVSDNAESDYITTLSPGFVLSYLEKTAGVEVGYQLDFTYFADGTVDNYIGHNGNLKAWWDATNHLKLGITDYLIRSNSPRDLYSEGDTRIESGRSLYTRNTVRPEVAYTFAKDSALTFAYQNIYYDNDDDSIADSMENRFSAGVDYSFNVRNNLEVLADYFTADFSDTTPPTTNESDFTGYSVGGIYTYNFTRRTAGKGTARYLKRDFANEDPTQMDYSLINIGIGAEHQFTKTLWVDARFGWFFRNSDGGDSLNEPEFELGVKKTDRRWNAELRMIKSVREEYFDRENLGFTTYWSIAGSFVYNIMERLDTALRAQYYEDDYVDDDLDRNTWDVSVAANYQPFWWLTVSGGYQFLNRDSSQQMDDFTDHRVFISLTASYIFPQSARNGFK